MLSGDRVSMSFPRVSSKYESHVDFTREEIRPGRSETLQKPNAESLEGRSSLKSLATRVLSLRKRPVADRDVVGTWSGSVKMSTGGAPVRRIIHPLKRKSSLVLS